VHLTALIESPDHVCCRYRLAAFQPYLEQLDHSLELRPFPRAWWSRLHLGLEVRHADVAILQRRLLPRWQRRLLRRAARVLLFDFDDAVFVRDSYAPRGPRSVTRLRRFAATVRAADVVVAGNAFLADAAAHWAGRHKVHVIPTCIEPDRYPLAAHTRAGKGVQLAWIGSSSTLRGLEKIAPLLETVGQRCPGVHLKVICDRFPELQHLPIIACPWSEASEARELAAADIGISWVPDDVWSRGKCGLKVLQYMAAGLPVVANPVGVHREMVRDGETGLLVETPRDWAESVGRLAADPDLRRRLGQAGRRRAERDYSVAAGAARWAELLASLRCAREAA
jgi:glycosyltransferase involved in cell wall biosynthesis